MKKLIVVLMIGIMAALGSVNAFAREIPAFKAGEYNPTGELVVVKAKGLVCEFCAKALEKVFMRQDEVAGIHVNLSTKDILISFKNGAALDDKTIEKFIHDAGYNIESILRETAGETDEANQ